MLIALAVAVTPDQSETEFDDLKAAIRIEANHRFREACGTVDIPENAFREIDITGDGKTELAVSLGRATCVSTGAPTNFTGTGGALNQFWTLSDDRPAMLIGTMMHGYSPTDDGLIAFQHGSFCGNYPGASLCVTTYRWDPANSEMRVADHRIYDDAHPGKEPAMAYDWAGNTSK